MTFTPFCLHPFHMDLPQAKFILLSFSHTKIIVFDNKSVIHRFSITILAAIEAKLYTVKTDEILFKPFFYRCKSFIYH